MQLTRLICINYYMQLCTNFSHLALFTVKRGVTDFSKEELIEPVILLHAQTLM